ncbi:MAG: histidine phosphatase family protein [Patescibacteria group bacterium]|nr:histidine phosphatase family protein [Patescibacteria group bacterium]MDE2233081.1 histidine phosphatase family protein [Patescibacteria group bacterium]
MNPKAKALASARNDKDIVIIRHGATPDEHTAMGGWSGEGLGAKGVEEAKRAAREVPPDVEGIVSSDLPRAVLTAEIISKATGIPIIAKDPALRSWKLGNLDGKSPDDVEPVLEHVAQSEPDMKLPGGGESFNQFKDRFLGGIKKLQEKYRGKKIAIVTHSHNTRVLRAWEKEGQPDNLEIDKHNYKGRAMENGGVEETKVKTKWTPSSEK